MKKLFLFFVLFYLVLVFTGKIDGHNQELHDWVTQNKPDELFPYPAIKYVGLTGFSLIGEIFFTVFPLTLFFSSIAIMVFLFKSFSFNQNFLVVFFLFIPKSLEYLMFFTKENIIFFFASAYSVLFFFALYKKKKNNQSFIAMFLLSITMCFFRELGLAFFFLTILLLAYFNKKKIGLFFPAIIPQTAMNLEKMFNYSLNAPLSFDPKNLFVFFQNPVFAISTFLFLKNKDFFQAIIIVLTIFYCFAATTIVGDGVFLRYSSGLMPLHFFYVMKAFK